MIYVILYGDNGIIACFRDPMEAEEYIEMIKEISRRYVQEYDKYQHRPNNDLQILLEKYTKEMKRLIEKHLPTEKKENVFQYADLLVDGAFLTDFQIEEVPLISMHQLTENTIRIKINA